MKGVATFDLVSKRLSPCLQATTAADQSLAPSLAWANLSQVRLQSGCRVAAFSASSLACNPCPICQR